MTRAGLVGERHSGRVHRRGQGEVRGVAVPADADDLRGAQPIQLQAMRGGRACGGRLSALGSRHAPTHPLPLARITVLDLTLARAGPTCVRHLADWGAQVIRIEPPATGGEDIAGDRDGPDFPEPAPQQAGDAPGPEIARGARGVPAASPSAPTWWWRTCAPTVKHRLRISPAELHALNPRIVYGSISGFGQDGPYAARAGVDQIAQGLGGLMSITGLPGQGPVRVGIPIADLTAGNLLALGIMVALFEREATGVGRWVHTSLLEAQVFMLDFQAARWLLTRRGGRAGGQRPPDRHPHRRCSRPATGRSTSPPAPAGNGSGSARRSATRNGSSARSGAPSRAAAPTAPRLNAAIAEITRTRPAAEWIALFAVAGIPCGPVNRIDDVFADPQVQHLGTGAARWHIRASAQQHLVASPLNLEGVPKTIRTASPEAGGDTDAVLRELGYGDANGRRLAQARA